jgi:hypothetical protein
MRALRDLYTREAVNGSMYIRALWLLLAIAALVLAGGAPEGYGGH